MGLSLKGLGRLAKKAAKYATPLLAKTPAGGIALQAVKSLKQVGVNLKKARKTLQPASLVALAEKQLGPDITSTLKGFGKKPKRTALPGGAVIAKPKKRRKKSEKGMPVGTKKERDAWLKAINDPSNADAWNPKPRKRRAKAKTAPGTSKRKPPRGGLDLKAMAADWRAAGKPGTWIGWIKANPIKKAS